MKSQQIEPGLISAFRFFAIFRTSIAVVYSIVVPRYVHNFPLAAPTMGILTGALLLLYLSSTKLHQRLGANYLRLAFVFATFDALLLEKIMRKGLADGDIQNFLAQVLFPNCDGSCLTSIMSNAAIAADFVGVSPPLAVLLVLLAWQYRYKVVALYALGTGIIDVVYAYVASATDIETAALIGVILPRTSAFLLMGYIITRLMKVQRQQREDLARANAKVSSYAAMVEDLAISRERNRLARELHDTLAHTLSASSVQLEAVNSLWAVDEAKAQTMLQRALDTNRNGLKETRRALQALRASPLEDLGLALAIRHLAEVTETRSGAKIEMHMHMPPTIHALPVQVEQVVYRTAQECLENTVRHANARCISISLLRDEARVCLDITDDGVGFDVAEAITEGHYGIRGILERVEALGGTIQIDSKPGAGARMRLEVLTS